jgi:hypothetical protein
MYSIEEKKSLNRDFRKRELLRVTLENYVSLKILYLNFAAGVIEKIELKR